MSDNATRHPGQPSQGALLRWSVSAAHTYQTCPLQWSYRYGPHKQPHTPEAPSVHRLRGRVLHEALAAAYQAADTELADTPGGLLPGTMTRYHRAARAALGVAWETHRMPSDSAEALECLQLLADVLDALPIPARGAIYAVEHRIRTRTAGGLLVVLVPDLVLRTGDGMIKVRDYKTGRVDPTAVALSQQLLIYAGLLAELDPTITGVEIELYSLRSATGHVVPADPRQVADAIDRLERTAATATADTDPAPRPGGHCASCPFQQVCPAMERRAA